MTQIRQSQGKRRILAVIVLYKLTREDSVSYQSLLKARAHVSDDSLDLSIVLYDNSSDYAPPISLDPNTRYIRAESNRGLASAYNLSLDLALREGFEWLFTLDQDTHLPLETMQHIVKTLADLDQRPDVAAVVPEIHASGRIVSPNYFAAGAWPRWFPEGFVGIPEQAVYAFNSASLLRTTALRQIGGYSPWFWLDNSDSVLYRRLHKFGKRVYVDGSWRVDHDFSLLNMQEKVSDERYKMILLTESAFWDMEMNPLACLERTGRLGGRIIKHWMRHDRAELARLTWRALWSRLVHSKARRMANWKEATERRLGGAPDGWQKPSRPMISVCMAAYNGGRYIEAQLQSILPQLEGEDEIVIVDDASRDNTVKQIETIVEGLAGRDTAPRIVLVKHQTNRGVVQTFEDAVRSASGDVLFLCDDDDLWAHDKVAKVLHIFVTQPGIDLVATGLSLIDEHDLPLADTGFMRHRRFRAGFVTNMFRNQYQGSTMAFRATLLETILPFPKDSLFLHDAWIGSRSALARRKAAFIDEPLLLYRRHTGNYSRRLDPLKQVFLRFQLLVAHLRFWLPTS